MVDINLLGEETPQQKGEENNEDFSNTYSTDAKELTSDTHLSNSDMNDDIYDKSYTHSGSRKVIFIIVSLILIASILSVGYYFISYKKNKSQLAESPDNKIEKTSKPSINTETSEISAVEVPLFVKEMISSSQHGVKVIETILTTLPPNINFTVIQYRDGNFLAELLGTSNTNFTDLNNKLQQKVSDGKVKILSQDKRTILGRTYKQTLLNGSITTPSIGFVKSPNYADSNSIKSKFSQYCKEIGLKLKQFEIKGETRTPNYKKFPVLFRAIGKKDAALNFLDKLIEENINVNLSKIVFIASERDLKNKNMNLILNMEIYHPI